MRALTTFDAVYLHREAVDMRKSLDGLSGIVRNGLEMVLDQRYLFVFVGRGRDRVKLLYWDRTGYALWYKRLERSRFPWPKDGENVIQISGELFSYLLDGVDVFMRPHADVSVAQNW
jgi:transposase